MTSPSAPPPQDLLAVAPRWVTLSGEVLDESQGAPLGLRAVTLVDEAVAVGAPWDGFPLQVGIGVALQAPDETGQPSAQEKPVLRAFETALVQALGPQGRVVATLTVDGTREYLCYVRSTDVLLSWREGAPEGMRSHDWQVQVLEDPTWLGLREIAGLLQPGEEQLGPLTEVLPPGSQDGQPE